MNFTTPINLGIHLTNVLLNPTNHKLAHVQYKYISLQQESKECTLVDNNLKKLLLTKIPALYTSTLKISITSFFRVSTKQILQQLYTTYGTLGLANLKNDN